MSQYLTNRKNEWRKAFPAIPKGAKDYIPESEFEINAIALWRNPEESKKLRAKKSNDRPVSTHNGTKWVVRIGDDKDENWTSSLPQNF